MPRRPGQQKEAQLGGANRLLSLQEELHAEWQEPDRDNTPSERLEAR